MKTNTLYLIAAILSLVMLSVSCGSAKKDNVPKRKQGWTDDNFTSEENACVYSYYNSGTKTDPIGFVEGFCKCVLDDLSHKFSYETVYAGIDGILSEEAKEIKTCKDINNLKLNE